MIGQVEHAETVRAGRAPPTGPARERHALLQRPALPARADRVRPGRAAGHAGHQLRWIDSWDARTSRSSTSPATPSPACTTTSTRTAWRRPSRRRHARGLHPDGRVGRDQLGDRGLARRRPGPSACSARPTSTALWELIAETTRLDAPDPVAAWREHCARLAARAAALNGLGLDASGSAAPAPTSRRADPRRAWGGGAPPRTAASRSCRTSRPRRCSRRPTGAAPRAPSARRCR